MSNHIIPEHFNPLISEMVNHWVDAASKANSMAVILRLVPERDGDKWRVSFGDITATGETPIAAYHHFDCAWYEKSGKSDELQGKK